MMQHREKRRAAPGSTAQIKVEISADDTTETLAARKVADRFRLTLPVARVVCELAGLGVSA